MTLNFLDDIERDLARWPGEVIENATHVRGYNTQRGEFPLFWCSQGAHAFRGLISVLGDSFSLYGLRSGHLVMEYTPENIDVLTDLYVQQINDICASKGLKKVTLGGNCQGAGLMLVIAQKLAQLGQLELSVLVLESIVPKHLSVPVTLIFGRNSSFNLYRRYHDVESGLSTYYPHLTIGVIPGSHGQFFLPEYVGYVGQFLQNQQSPRNVIFQSARCATHPYDAVTVEQAFTQLKIVDLMLQESELASCAYAEITIVFENSSSQDIAANQFSVANQWHLADSRVVYQWLDAQADMPLIPANTRVNLKLRVRAPLSAGHYVMRLRLTTAGVGFQEFEEEISISVYQSSPHLRIVKPDSTTSYKKTLMPYVRSGCIDHWVNRLPEAPCLTRRQWRLMLTLLAKDERWQDIATIGRVLSMNHALDLHLFEIYVEALLKVGEAGAALFALEQKQSLHNYKVGLLNRLYLHALLHTGYVQIVYQKLYLTKSFPIERKDHILLLMLNPGTVNKLTPEQVALVVTELYASNKGTESFLKMTHALLAKKLNDSAFKLLTEAIALFPHNASFMLRLARLHDAVGNKEAALIHFQRVLELAPGNVEAMRWLEFQRQGIQDVT